VHEKIDEMHHTEIYGQGLIMQEKTAGTKLQEAWKLVKDVWYFKIFTPEVLHSSLNIHGLSNCRIYTA
jgi:hypothetical protein